MSMFYLFISSIKVVRVSLSLKYVDTFELALLRSSEMFPTWFFMCEYPPQCWLSPLRATFIEEYMAHFVYFISFYIDGMITKEAMEVANMPRAKMAPKKATQRISNF